MTGAIRLLAAKLLLRHEDDGSGDAADATAAGTVLSPYSSE
jgi:hypothetical protein